MTREEITNKVLASTSNNFILELATGTGKTAISLKKIAQWHVKDNPILIVIPKLVLIPNWKAELAKFGYEYLLNDITFSTYVSLPKHVGKEYDTICLDECFRGDTEILTDKGFKRFDTLDGTELVAQWEDNGNISFVSPIRHIKNPYKGELCKVHLGRERYVFMTPNHQQVYRTTSVPVWRTKSIKDFKSNNGCKIPVSGNGTGNNASLTTLERLYIAIQADGTLQRHQINESVYSIHVTKQRKKDRLKTLLIDYGRYTCIKGRSEVDRYIVKFPKGDAKLLSTHFDINMGYNRANEFINEILEWDGSKSLEGNTIYYSSKIKENSDFVAAIAVQAGYKILQGTEEDHRKPNYSTIHRVYMRKQYTINTQPMKKNTKVFHEGYVYCVEVPSHKIIVRSQGYTFVSGNCHHTSERCMNALQYIKCNHLLALSATLKKEHRYFFTSRYKAEVVKVDTKEAIESDILPDPKLILIPLKLDNTKVNCIIEKNIKKNNDSVPKTISYTEKWKYRSYKGPLRILCTSQQYYDDITGLIEWYKQKGMSNAIMKNMWLHKAGERLKWLACQKEELVRDLIKQLKNYRLIAFCPSIEESNKLGCPCINSKVGTENLDKFNTKKIKHVACVNMVDEGINLSECKIGIFQMINASLRVSKQREGRILRHKEPVFIFPYYIDTREEEIVNNIIKDYNPNLIIKTNSVHHIHDIKSLL